MIAAMHHPGKRLQFFGMLVTFLVNTVAWSVSARADWQFTKWGMTRGQVAAASIWLATTDPDGNLSMPYSSGPFTFQATFHFGQKDTLESVELELLSGSVPMLPKALRDKYGAPVNDQGDGGLMSSTDWQTATDSIHLFRIGSILGEYAGVKTKMRITYKPRMSGGASGL
jgi:hypothetical protein